MLSNRPTLRRRFASVSRGLNALKSARAGLALALTISAFGLSQAALRAKDVGLPQPLRVLIVGGGPDLQNNQVAIESNVRYVTKLLPQNTTHTTLFADGDPNHATVLYEDDSSNASSGERLFGLIQNGVDSDGGGTHYRKPNLGATLDGASRQDDIQRAFTRIVSEQDTDSRPLLLYFTGHGSTNRNDLENNMYDLWGGNGGITVRDLSKQIARLPEGTPITIVMVQCFSGAFGNLIFEDGNPKGEPVKRDLAGFFATVKERVAAGCTSAVNEAEYHDFTSYFFAALTGRDRVGRRVTGADYNGDGRVGMDEAYCYTLINDQSIDVPICTSDVFLRRYVPVPDAELFQTPYSSILNWATPAQRAALEALSKKLNKSGEDRINGAYNQMVQQTSGSVRGNVGYRDAMQKLNMLRKEAKNNLIGRWPELRRPGTDDYKQAHKEAAAQLEREAQAGKWKDLLDASDAVDKSIMDAEGQEIAASQNLRYVRLGKSVILAHWLKMNGAPEVKARLARLQQDESATALPPFGQALKRSPASDAGVLPSSAQEPRRPSLPQIICQ